MNIELTNFHGWENTIRLANDAAEVFITTDVGPRILGYKTRQGENVLKVFTEQTNSAGEEEWCIRGGHRLWLAPEDTVLSYHIDNGPVKWSQDETTRVLTLESLQKEPQPLRKALQIHLDEGTSHLSVHHAVTNEGENPIDLAPWALTVMEKGGLEIIPQPPLGSHPADLLPNRTVVLWPYTDLSDPRWIIGQKYWMLRQEEGYLPTKIGLAHQEKWIAYLLNDSLFIKTFNYHPGAAYPDGGCNFETFTNTDMLEIESLGELVTLQPGQTVTHNENWYLFPLVDEVQIESEEALAEWLAPYLAQTNIA